MIKIYFILILVTLICGYLMPENIKYFIGGWFAIIIYNLSIIRYEDRN